ncbi:MAG: CRISPR-associated protein Cas5 [Candidatus Aminicenantes bacterium]|nr:CRISPR-associated protein Cas5 [Candidatus Aminicenantes bacterium]
MVYISPDKAYFTFTAPFCFRHVRTSANHLLTFPFVTPSALKLAHSCGYAFEAHFPKASRNSPIIRMLSGVGLALSLFINPFSYVCSLYS